MKHSEKPVEVMGIDPSINECGAAIINQQNATCLWYGLIKPKKRNISYEEKSFEIIRHIDEISQSFRIRHIILEVPEYWRVAGYIARESGSIFKVSFLCGMIYGLQYRSKSQVTVTLVSPSQWKGQMSKVVCRNRLKKWYESKVDNFMMLNHNVVDAIGLCHWFLYGKV